MITATRAGWVTQAPADEMLAAVPPGTIVRLETRTGAYIHGGEALATEWLPPGSEDDSVTDAVRGAVAVADVRTMQQDVDFALRQLVDIGLRALSQSINDPTTAVEAILRLGGLMRRLPDSDLPSAAVGGPEGRVLLRPWVLTHQEYVAHAFDQLRQTAGSQTQVLAALLPVLRMLRAHVQEVGRAEHAPAIEGQLEIMLETISSQRDLHPADRDRLLATARNSTNPADHTAR